MTPTIQKFSFPFWLTAAFLMLSAGIIVTGILHYRIQEKQIRQNSEEVLKTIADLKARQIADWRRERIADALMISRNPLFSETFEKFLKGDNLSKDIIYQGFNQIKIQYGYHNIILLDKNGQVQAAAETGNLHIMEETLRVFQEAVKTRRVVFGDFYRYNNIQAINIDLVAPLFADTDKRTDIIGAVVLRIDPNEFLYPLIQSWPLPSQSSETLLFRREEEQIVFLNELRHQKNTALSFKISVTETKIPSVMAVNDITGIVDGYDYRGIKVLASINAIPNSDWYMVAKTDAEEVFAPLKYQTRLLISFIFVLIILIAVLIALVSNLQGKKLYKQLYLSECERRRSETALKDSETRLALAAQSASIGIWDWNFKLNKLIWDDKMYELYGIDKEHFIGTYEAWTHALHPEDAEEAVRCLHDSLKEHKKFNKEFRIVRPDGSVRYLKALADIYTDESGEANRMIGVNFDITAQKQAEIHLKESKEYLQIIFDQATDGIFIANQDGRYIDANNAALTMVGYTKKELLELSIPQLMAEEEFSRIPEYFEELIREKSLMSEWKMQRKDGTIFDAEVSTTFLPNSNYQAFVRDITERKNYEKNLIRAKEEADRANRAKSEFLANISHEIRTPMNAILGFSELLKSRITDLKNKEYLNGILFGGKTLLSLINDILDLSKIEAGRMDIRPEPTDIHKLIQDFKTIFAAKESEKQIRMTIDIAERVPRFVIIDEVRIRQILLNLIGNAFKFTDKGIIAVKVDGPSDIRDESKIELIFEVSDSGIGIPENQQDTIFEAFIQQNGQSTRKYGGTGLGLTITKRLTETMNGRIEIKSKPGKGSTFRVYIPDVIIAAGVIGQDNTGDMSCDNMIFEKSVILLAEDVKSNRDIVKGYLEGCNLTLMMAGNGQEAVKLAQRIRPDLILMDMMMPVMDGYDAVKLIKSDTNLKNIPVIALTASIMSRDKNNIRVLCDDYLRKPVSRKELLQTLAKFLPCRIEIAPENKAEKQESTTEMFFSPEQSAELKEIFMPMWNNIAPLMSNDDIIRFAGQLKSYANTHKYSVLERYAENLYNYAEFFDIENMNKEFKNFPNLIAHSNGE